MRLGEIKIKIKQVLNDENKIIIENEPIYGGQAYNINNFEKLIQALDLLQQQPWNTLDYSVIDSIKSKYGIFGHIQIDQNEFNQLSSYISSLNEKIPFYFSILSTAVGEQDEKIINLKLPDNQKTFKKLNELNTRLEKLFKLFQIDAEFQFHGFDSGTDWYMVIATGILSHQYLIACLQVAQEFLKMKSEYYKSEQARLDYEASIRESEKYSDKALDEYSKKRMDLQIANEVKKVIDEIKERNGETEESLHVKLVKATTSLIAELGEGTEFHLSLNPPVWAEEDAGRLVINYKNIPKIETVEEVKQLEAPVVEPEIDELPSEG